VKANIVARAKRALAIQLTNGDMPKAPSALYRSREPNRTARTAYSLLRNSEMRETSLGTCPHVTSIRAPAQDDPSRVLPFLPGCFPPEFLMRDVPSRAHAGFMVRDVLLISIDLTEFRLTPRLMLSTALLPTSAKCYARVPRLSQDSLSELLSDALVSEKLSRWPSGFTRGTGG
jgi:hypothetical protein